MKFQLTYLWCVGKLRVRLKYADRRAFEFGGVRAAIYELYLLAVFCRIVADSRRNMRVFDGQTNVLASSRRPAKGIR